MKVIRPACNRFYGKPAAKEKRASGVAEPPVKRSSISNMPAEEADGGGEGVAENAGEGGRRREPKQFISTRELETQKAPCRYTDLLEPTSVGIPDVYLVHAHRHAPAESESESECESDLDASRSASAPFGLLVAAARHFANCLVFGECEFASREAAMQARAAAAPAQQPLPGSRWPTPCPPPPSAQRVRAPFADSDDPGAIRFWIDIFAVMQHECDAKEQDVAAIPACVSASRCALVVVDADRAAVLKRLWPTYELALHVRGSLPAGAVEADPRVFVRFGMPAVLPPPPPPPLRREAPPRGGGGGVTFIERAASIGLASLSATASSSTDAFRAQLMAAAAATAAAGGGASGGGEPAAAGEMTPQRPRRYNSTAPGSPRCAMLPPAPEDGTPSGAGA